MLVTPRVFKGFISNPSFFYGIDVKLKAKKKKISQVRLRKESRPLGRSLWVPYCACSGN